MNQEERKQLDNFLTDKVQQMNQYRLDMDATKMKAIFEGYRHGIHYSIHLCNTERRHRRTTNVQISLWGDSWRTQHRTTLHEFIVNGDHSALYDELDRLLNETQK